MLGMCVNGGLVLYFPFLYRPTGDMVEVVENRHFSPLVYPTASLLISHGTAMNGPMLIDDSPLFVAHFSTLLVAQS